MQEFHAENKNLFVAELDEISNKYRSNIQYFIYKSIILRNLYGVDIMVEATEIAKLRLFLKMVAVVEVDRRAPNLGLDPLPDIDFNIRCGNTLFGYTDEASIIKDLGERDVFASKEFRAKIELEMSIIASTYESFKKAQLSQDPKLLEFKLAKRTLSERLKTLNSLLNKNLYGGNREITFDDWLSSVQPFHWVAEFYQIISDGGFDVIIGNPPYVEYAKKNKETGKAIRDIYKLDNYKTINCGNLYAYVVERSCSISKNRNNIGFIVPLSLASNNNMLDLRKFICEQGSNWFSHYEVRPAKLFDGAEQRLTIFFKRNTVVNQIFSTAIHRWHNEHRNLLFKSISYAPSFNNGSIWRTSSVLESSIYKKFMKQKLSASYLNTGITQTKVPLNYRTAGVRYWIIFLNSSFGTESLSNKTAYFYSENEASFFMAAFNSNMFWWYYALNFDMFNLKDYMIFAFRLTYDPSSSAKIIELSKELELDMDNKKVEQVINSKTRGIVTTSYYQKKQSKSIIDKIDIELAKLYGLTDEELDFIINYDIKYRMGEDLNSEE
jgi:hypothetical protein